MTSAKLLEHFPGNRRIFINMLMDTTIFCDCWSMTTPRLIPDIGILAGNDIVAIEQATLDLIDREELIPNALPPGWDLADDPELHLFERIHHKDPYAVVRYLEELDAVPRSMNSRRSSNQKKQEGDPPPSRFPYGDRISCF